MLVRSCPAVPPVQVLGSLERVVEESPALAAVGAGCLDDGLPEGVVRGDQELVSLVQALEVLAVGQACGLSPASVARRAGQDQVPGHVQVAGKSTGHERLGNEVNLPEFHAGCGVSLEVHGVCNSFTEGQRERLH